MSYQYLPAWALGCFGIMILLGAVAGRGDCLFFVGVMLIYGTCRLLPERKKRG